MDIVLIRPQTPENIGFIARCMANFDLTNLILIDPQCELDEARKTAKHAQDILDKAQTKPYTYFKQLTSVYDVVAGTTSVLGTDYNIPRTPLSPGEFVSKINNESVALVLGTESSGLTNEEIDLCHFIISIPTSSNYAAMNISHAAAILFYEWYKHKGKNAIDDHIKPISKKEKEVLMALLHDIIDTIEFSTEHKKNTQKITWTRLLDKAMLSKRESFVVIGFLRKLLTRLERGDD